MTSRLTEEELEHALDLVKSGAGHHASGFVHEMIDELRAARAELARIRPVFEAACAWRECRASDTRRLMEMVRALTAAIDTARSSSAKGE